MVCPAGSYQPLQGQSRCEACRFGFTTRDLGAVNASACIPIAEALRNPSNNSGLFESFNNSVVSANAVSYASNMTCEEFLTAYGNINDLGYRGDGICNPGLLNTPNCGYDVSSRGRLWVGSSLFQLTISSSNVPPSSSVFPQGGDCCAQTCKPGGAVPALTASDLNDLSEILKYTNDTQVIAAISQPIKGIEDFTITYTYGCSPFSFDCRDPAVLSQPLNCSAPKPPTPEVETYLNASCGNYELDPAYGDGFCDARLNFFECNYDGMSMSLSHDSLLYTLLSLLGLLHFGWSTDPPVHMHTSPSRSRRRLLPADMPFESIQRTQLRAKHLQLSRPPQQYHHGRLREPPQGLPRMLPFFLRQ